MDDGWCGVCETTTYGECLHYEDGTTIPHPRDEIERLREDATRLDWLHDHIISTGSAEFFAANIRDTDEIHMVFDPGAVVETVREAIDARRALEVEGE